MAHVDDRLPHLLLGTLEPSERALLDEHVGACAACADRLRGLGDAVASLAGAAGVAPAPAALRGRLLGSLGHLNRFAAYAPALAELLDRPLHETRRDLFDLSRTNEWEMELLPGMRIHPLRVGPAKAGSMALLACFAPGTGVPPHRHLGRETIQVLQGAFEESGGRVIGPGDALVSEVGSGHAMRIVGDVDCLCAILNEGPIEMGLS
jgi:putative transcriptional regulator